MNFKKLNEVPFSDSIDTVLGVKGTEIVQTTAIPSGSSSIAAPYVIDSEAYTYGDDALQAILEGRQIYVKVPNVNDNTLYTNFMPVLQYQLPTNNNDYLTLFYLKDGIATNLVTALQGMMQGNTSGMSAVFGEITMLLSESYKECPLKVDPVK